MRSKLELWFAAALALAAGCSSKAGSAPVIHAFTATPGSIHPGESSTLAWDVTFASQVSIDNGVGAPAGNSVQVSPAATTTYTLTASGASGDSTATATVTVLPPAGKPVIAAFKASPSDVPVGGTTTLSWTVTGATSLTLDPGAVDVTGLSQQVVSVAADTTYTLTAANPAGAASQAVAVMTHDPSLRLQYTDPVSPTARILLVRNVDLSTNNRVVLDVKVGAAPVTAFGFAINLPLDATGATMVLADDALTPAGLITGGAIQAGASPATAALLLTRAAANPVMGDLLTAGVAKNRLAAGAADDTWPAAATLFSIGVKINSAAAAGNTVFTSAAASASPRFKAAAIDRAGNDVVGTADVALGDLIISL